MAVSAQSFILIAPAFISFPTSMASSFVFANTAALKPYIVSLASAIASLFVLNFIIGIIGPNVSSCIIFILCFTFVSMVGLQ